MGTPNMTHHSADYKFRMRDCLLGAQTLFIAMGALVLVPLLTGMDPNVALFTAGSGTLIFQLLTKGKIPAFLGSSFAFVPATIYGIQTWGLPSTLCGLSCGGLVYLLLAAAVKLRGRAFINKLLPPTVTGPVIISIGLILAPVAVNMSMGRSGDGQVVLFDENLALMLASIALVTTMLVRLLGKGRIKLIPILAGVTIGYISALFMGIIDFSSVTQAAWFKMPEFTTPVWHWQAIILILPIAVISAIEHIGDVVAIGTITKRNYVQDPGLHRSLSGDGIATIWASLMGGPPNTTYSEVTAGVALTKIYNPGIMTWSCIVAIGLAFVGKAGLLLQTIPAPVMGGILILLFGAIAVTGLNLLVQSGEDLMQPRSMTIVGIILIIPLGGLSIGAGDFALSGIGLGGILGVLLNLVLPYPDKQTRSA